MPSTSTKTGKDAAPELGLGRLIEADAAAGPEIVGGVDVFGDEGDLGGLADEAEIFRAAGRGDEGEDGAAVGRGNGDPAAEFEALVGDDAEAERLT